MTKKIYDESGTVLAELNESIRLNLGCGQTPLSGYINIDKIKMPGVDMIVDLEKTPLPFKDNSVYGIRADHILEHISNLLPLLEDIHRICINKAILEIRVPYYKYEGAYRDITHVRFFTEHSFDYFRNESPFSHYSPARFEVIETKLHSRFFSNVKSLEKEIMPHLFCRKLLNIFLWNVYSELEFKIGVQK